MPNFTDMLSKAQEMQKKMADIQSEINTMEVEGTSGGDMVKALVRGDKKILSLNLNSDILNEDKEMLEDLILVAINQAIEKVDSISKDKMGPLTGGMNVPGLF